MAKNGRPTQRQLSSATNNGFRGYVNYDITAGEKKKFLAWVEDVTSDGLWLDLERVVDNGYKFSTKTDNYGGGVQAALTCGEKTNDDCGLVLTARAPDLLNAMLLLLYKHNVLLGGKWSTYHDQSKKISEWG